MKPAAFFYKIGATCVVLVVPLGILALLFDSGWTGLLIFNVCIGAVAFLVGIIVTIWTEKWD